MFKWLRRRFEKPIPLTTREREALARENDEAHRQAMPDPVYGISTAGGRAAGNYFVSTNDALSRAPEEVSKERGDRPARPNIN